MSEKGVSLGRGWVEHETDKAILVVIDGMGKNLWIPKSQIHDDSEVYRDGQQGEVVVTQWWAGKQGLV